MGSPTGFLDYTRARVPLRPVETRLKDYKEVTCSLPPETLTEQAARCMDCGTPFCHGLGCPNYNLIPDFNALVHKGRWKDAYETLTRTNFLSDITGRICPAPCESSCTLSINDAPVTIKHIEKMIADTAWQQGWMVPQLPERESGKRVAIIGSGPAGLTAAHELRTHGHEVVVFEKSPYPGGILRYGIPDFKLEKHVLDRKCDILVQEGVRFENNTAAGSDVSVKYLRDRFDALLLCQGAGTPRDLSVDGRQLEGIHFAMDYLAMSNLYVAGHLPEERLISAAGKTVLVIGGGDTGSDCVGTANRQGAKKVYQFEIMPKPPVWEKPYNPQWPDWPHILRTSSSHEEGCSRDWNITTERFEGQKRVRKGVFSRVQWKTPQPGGKAVMEPCPDSSFTLDVDLVLLAMGFVHTAHGPLTEECGVTLDNRGNIAVDESYATSVPGIYAAGDAATGASLVIRAIYHGRNAATHINRFLD